MNPAKKARTKVCARWAWNALLSDRRDQRLQAETEDHATAGREALGLYLPMDGGCRVAAEVLTANMPPLHLQ